MPNIQRSHILIALLFVLLIFTLTVTYAFINSSIRSREKQVARAPLEECLEDVKAKSLDDITTFAKTAMNSLDPTWQAECEKRREQGVQISPSFCRPWTKQAVDAGYEDIERKTAAARDECYRRYK